MGSRLSAYRRPLAVLCAAAGTGFGLLALRPDAASGEPVLIAARDLPDGTALRHADLRMVTVPASAVPSGALRGPAATGRVLAGPMRRGEPMTDVRLVSTGLLHGYGPDTVAVPVRVADAGTVGLLRRGDRVDVLAPPRPAEEETPARSPAAGAHRARLIAASAPVIAVPRPRGQDDQGALIVLAAGRPQAAVLAGAGPDLALSIAKAW